MAYGRGDYFKQGHNAIPVETFDFQIVPRQRGTGYLLFFDLNEAMQSQTASMSATAPAPSVP